MPKRVLRIELLAAASMLAAAVSCGSNTQSGGDFGNAFGGDDGGGGQSSGGSSGGSSSGGSGAASGSSSGGSSGQNPGGSSGASGGGSSGGSSGGGSLDGGSGGGSSNGGGVTDGSIAPALGCGQATSCTPGSDLAPPASADGFQIVLPAGSVTITPGEEAYYCYDKVVPGGQAINAGAFQSWMTTGASHHFITYMGSGTDGALTGGPVGAAACNPTGNWVYATSTSGQVIELKMPDGVGIPMPANQILILNMHFINPGSTNASPEVKLNVLYQKNFQYAAQSMVSFNAGIYVAPGGTQTLTGRCIPPAGSKFFTYTTHAHHFSTELDVNYVSGGVTTNIVKSTQWDAPQVALWNAPNFLTIKSGDQITYSCSYKNTSGITVTLGETAASNEMCMSIGYFFPAAQVSSGIGSSYCN
jgi:hypothetical protein